MWVVLLVLHCIGEYLLTTTFHVSSDITVMMDVKILGQPLSMMTDKHQFLSHSEKSEETMIEAQVVRKKHQSTAARNV